jgi:predicted transcriptional regulator YdeE
MHTFESTESFTIAGLELRTTNEQAFETIPAHWERFHRGGALAAIPGRASDDVYAVYTNFEHPGVDNLGVYSLILGARVTGAQDVPPGMTAITVAAARHAVFTVATGHPERVGARWQDIWGCTDIAKSYLCDHERYRPNGAIDIFVGTR